MFFRSKPWFLGIALMYVLRDDFFGLWQKRGKLGNEISSSLSDETLAPRTRSSEGPQRVEGAQNVADHAHPHGQFVIFVNV